MRRKHLKRRNKEEREREKEREKGDQEEINLALWRRGHELQLDGDLFPFPLSPPPSIFQLQQRFKKLYIKSFFLIGKIGLYSLS
jgi:hypothetical protein